MKTSSSLLIASLALILLFGCGSSQKIIAPTAKSMALDKMVAAEAFVFEAEWARPFAASAMTSLMNSNLMPPGSTVAQINIMGSANYFKMEGDTVSANLPYFGERQMGGGYGTQAGIVFEGVPRDLAIEKDEEKLGHTITFNISERTETYRCRLDITRNQNATLQINSSQRFTIRYEGQVKALEGDIARAK